jgi:hypothetical protein
MPWQYPDRKMWEAIFPLIVGKTFSGKLHDVKHGKRTKVIVDGRVPQFDELPLYIGDDYTGIVIKKISSYVYVDFGYQFDWEYGSYVGLLHCSAFDSMELFQQCKVGQEIDVKYLGNNKIGQFLLGRCDRPYDEDDNDGKDEEEYENEAGYEDEADEPLTD